MEKSEQIFKESCKQLGISEELPTHPNPKREKAFQALHKLEVITEAKNGDWKANFANWDQKKWIPFFVGEKDNEGNLSGFRFYGTLCDYTYTDAGAGSRFCFPTSDMAREVGTKYECIYEKLQTLN